VSGRELELSIGANQRALRRARRRPWTRSRPRRQCGRQNGVRSTRSEARDQCSREALLAGRGCVGARQRTQKRLTPGILVLWRGCHSMKRRGVHYAASPALKWVCHIGDCSIASLWTRRSRRGSRTISFSLRSNMTAKTCCSGITAVTSVGCPVWESLAVSDLAGDRAAFSFCPKPSHTIRCRDEADTVRAV
jgi:hypothetical protein